MAKQALAFWFLHAGRQRTQIHKICISCDLRPKFPPALHGVLGVKSLALGSHLVHCLSLQKFHGRQVAQG